MSTQARFAARRAANYIVQMFCVSAFAALPVLAASRNPAPQIDITLASSLPSELSGRVLVFAVPAQKSTAAPNEVDFGIRTIGKINISAFDVASFGEQRHTTIDLDRAAAPQRFSALPSGEYHVQVVLDPNGNYGMVGRGAGDILSKVVTLRLPLRKPASISLERALPKVDLWNDPNASSETRAKRAAARPLLTEVIHPSAALTGFWGRPISQRAWVLLPPDYNSQAGKTWPVVYSFGGFFTTHEDNLDTASQIAVLNEAKALPSMIWVFPDFMTETSATEFADSVNNGPWGRAFTTELIPALEQRFRMDARPAGRFLIGRSSGGWAALWLQVRYADLFGGAWAAAPDSSDFHDFTGVDLYAPNANMYYDERGALRPIARMNGQVVVTMRDLVAFEEVMGAHGGQFSSFEWVFSPRGALGKPVLMFNRTTGAVDPTVVAYWRERYDIARLLEAASPELKRNLQGKIHIVIAEQDTFYLDGAVRRLKSVMEAAQIVGDFSFLPGKNHFDLYERDGDSFAVLKEHARAMYAATRAETGRPGP